MGHANDESRRYRRSDDEDRDGLTRTPEPNGGGAPRRVVRTKSLGAYPAATSQFFACEPALIAGTEAEGSSGVLTWQSDLLYVLVFGSSVPPVGTILEATRVASRWVATYN